MHHEHHYTLEQANRLRPWVAERVEVIRGARERLVAGAEETAEALAALNPQTGGSYAGTPEIARNLLELNRALSELQAVDIMVRDVDRGLVDFPSVRDGAEIYLCWLLDEDEIRYWHDPDAGFAGRQPL